MEKEKKQGCGKIFHKKRINRGCKGVEIKEDKCGMGFWLSPQKRIILLCPDCELKNNKK